MTGFVGLILKDGETPQTARERIVRELDAETIAILEKVKQTPQGSSVIELPFEDGYSLISKMRTGEAQRGGQMLPAIAVTCAAREEDRIRALSAGFQFHMSKPVEVYELVKVVASLAGRKDCSFKTRC